MPDIARLNDFQPGQTISSAAIDAELNQLVETVNALADKDGTLQVNLNADLLDGYSASATGGTGTIPVCNGTLQVALNAEKLGGLTASDFADAGFPAGTALVFYQSAAPAGWTVVSRPAVDRVLGWGSSAAGGAANSFTSWAGLSSYVELEIDDHVLTVAEIPAHTHTTSFATVTAGPSVESFSLNPSTAFSAYATSSAGGGGGHSHTGLLDFTDGGGTAWRVPISWTIIATKDA